ncbi:MAG: hypothetical protein ACI8RZ_006954 [Myxococcota bacterium]|jgi:hypothetical protein
MMPDHAEQLAEYEGYVYIVELLSETSDQALAFAYGTLAAVDEGALIIEDGQVQLLEVGEPLPAGVMRWSGAQSYAESLIDPLL